MSSTLKVFITNIGRYVDFSGGETLSDILARVAGEIGFDPICARVNNKTETLSYQVFAPKQVEYLPVTSPSGSRVCVRSLCMILYKAVTRLWPGARLNICHSISRGYLCRISGVTANEENASAIRAAMREIVAEDIPFERKERLTADVIEMFRRQGLDDKVRLLETTRQLYTVYYRLGDLIDTYYGALAPSTGCLRVFDLVVGYDGFLLMPPSPENPDVPRQPVTQEKMYEAFTDYVKFNHVVGVDNVGRLNKTTLEGRSADLINVAEALHDKKIAGIADEIARRYHEGGAKIVLIAGPSSSGKTTTAKKLSIYLMTNLLRPRMISLDNYFVDRHLTPRDESGDYDYESLYALDLDLFNRDLNALLAGEEVRLPVYDFHTGSRRNDGPLMRLDEGDILIIEGIHGLNPELTASVPEKMKFRVYVSSLTTLAIDDHNWVPTTDNRLLRRIIRDHKYRGTSPLDTIRRWPSVRRGEERWIFPYQENADMTFNSSLIFELAVMRPYADEILRYFPNDVPEYGEAHRLLKFLSYFTPITSEAIPPTSLLREFLGGSSFHY